MRPADPADKPVRPEDIGGQGGGRAPAAIFATTRWSVILRAGHDGEEGHIALETLCRAYWHPLRAYLLRAGHAPTDAEDLTQDFFAQLLRRGSLARVVPERGRFRNFLLVALRNFLSDHRDKAGAERRGGKAATISLEAAGSDESCVEIARAATPEQAFERQWAWSVLARARRRLREECAASGRLAAYEALGPEGDDSGETYEEIGRRLGLGEEGVKSAAFRLRRRYRELIRAEVADTVGSEADLEEELRHLLQILDEW